MPARRISIVNQKGGVAKTTTAVNLAVALASRLNRVLLVDYDPQGNASQFLGVYDQLGRADLYTSASFTLDARAAFAPVKDVNGHRGLDLVPANDTLADLELELLRDSMGASARLSQAVARVEPHYDFILADCAPTLGMLAINAMVACPDILIPVKLEPASLPGAVRLAGHLQGLREKVNPSIEILGVLATFFKETGTMSREVLGQLAELFGDRLLKTRIHDSASIGKSAGKGAPIYSLAPGQRGAVEYDQLTDELLDLIKNQESVISTQKGAA